jgi:hypothetical protein
MRAEDADPTRAVPSSHAVLKIQGQIVLGAHGAEAWGSGDDGRRQEQQQQTNVKKGMLGKEAGDGGKKVSDGMARRQKKVRWI